MPFNKTRFGRLSLLLMAIGFAALLTTKVGMLWLVEETRSFATGVITTQEIRTAAGRVLSLVQDAETSQRGYLLTAEDAYLEPYRHAMTELPREIPALVASIIADGGSEVAARNLQRQVEAKLAELAETVALGQAGDREGALALVRTDRGRAEMDAIRQVVAGIEARSLARGRARSEGLVSNGRLLLLGSAGALLLMLAVTIGAGLLARRYTQALETAQAEVVTANASLEARVAERTAALAAANDEVQRFAYIVSHDLRAPLVNVMGFTTELEAAVEPLGALLAATEREAPALVTPEARAAVLEDIPEAVGFIRSSTARMDRLINAILRLSREGRRLLHPEPIDFQALLAGLVATQQHQLDEAGASVSLAPGLPRIHSDRLAVEQIFGNLIDNAVKYLDPARPGRIAIRGRTSGSHVVVEVEDNGRGIDPRDHGRIFELFRRSGRQDRPGEGIGLAHVRALARRLGGDVVCRSAPGHGSTFRVTLALTAPAQPQSAAEDIPA
ncbi:CHASE3 domain-containing protein [Belnapia sp. F-4-1]|uniref:sensor histidine kinase n=1 Tax=Belnapia sp. F-4-1 TaxID=1545443 RepID=UPI0005BAB494|nr:CHASE3 domain-containing protein [Belnapia sp. F-4-1]